MPKVPVRPPPEIVSRFGDAKVCTRARAAFILGISVAELARREQDGIYPHERDLRGRVWYDEENIRRIAGDVLAARTREKAGRPPLVREPSRQAERKPHQYVHRNGYDAQTAAKVFRLLMMGKSLEETIVELEVHPDQALAIFESYSKVKRWTVLKDEHLAQMAHLPLRGGWPPKTAEQFVLMIRGTMECGLSKCAKCKTSYARLCASCAAAMPRSHRSEETDKTPAPPPSDPSSPARLD